MLFPSLSWHHSLPPGTLIAIWHMVCLALLNAHGAKSQAEKNMDAYTPNIGLSGLIWLDGWGKVLSVEEGGCSTGWDHLSSCLGVRSDGQLSLFSFFFYTNPTFSVRGLSSLQDNLLTKIFKWFLFSFAMNKHFFFFSTKTFSLPCRHI